MTIQTPRIERGAGVAVWRQIEDWLAGQIGCGTLGPGTRLPTEAQLAASAGVNRHTVRRAIASLAERGLVRVEQGRGSFVQDLVLDYPLRRRTSFSANLLQQDRTPGHRIVDLTLTAADTGVARALRLAVGTPVYCLRLIGSADEVPVTFGSNHLPRARVPDLPDLTSRSQSVSQLFKLAGITSYRRQSTRIIARLPSIEEATHLRQASNQPILVTEALDVDEGGVPIRFGLTCFAGARVQLTVEAESPSDSEPADRSG